MTDAAGQPVSGASIRIDQTAHAFRFGTAVSADLLVADSGEAGKYREMLGRLFNAASLENDLKWPAWAGEWSGYDRRRTLEALAWLKENGFAVRGHVMVWPGWKNLPESVRRLRGTADEKRIPGLVLEHIRDIGAATKPFISEWDVLNEPYNNHDLMDAFGRSVMVDWFDEASRLLPGVPLYLNDWGNHDQSNEPDHVRHFEETARYLLDHGAKLGGLGLQCHIGGLPSSPEALLATLDRYRETLGLPVRVTEFDVNTDDDELRAGYTRDFLIAMFSHPSVAGVQFWGFWAGRHWLPKAALYGRDWTETPAGAVYRELYQQTWHTRDAGLTDREGRWATRGFYGRYNVEVKRDGKTQVLAIAHEPGETGPYRVVLPPGF